MTDDKTPTPIPEVSPAAPTKPARRPVWLIVGAAFTYMAAMWLFFSWAYPPSSPRFTPEMDGGGSAIGFFISRVLLVPIYTLILIPYIISLKRQEKFRTCCIALLIAGVAMLCLALFYAPSRLDF